MEAVGLAEVEWAVEAADLVVVAWVGKAVGSVVVAVVEMADSLLAAVEATCSFVGIPWYIPNFVHWNAGTATHWCSLARCCVYLARAGPDPTY